MAIKNSIPHGIPAARPIFAPDERPSECVSVGSALCSSFVTLILDKVGEFGLPSDELVGCSEVSERELAACGTAES
jgi:hypothetical protein